MTWRTEEAIRGRFYDEDGRPVDAGGAVVPHKLSASQYLRGAGVLGTFDKRVPPEYFTEEVTDEELFAVIRCVCGETPTVHLNGLHTCGCERVFLYEGAPGAHGRRAVFVAKVDPPRTPDDRS